MNHLRDKLIPLHKRKELLWAWNEAIKTSNTDSRIQSSVVLHNGEEFNAMSWIEKINAVPQNSSKSKKWQSSAFDSVISNVIASPPTPCLKIRHMFDMNEVNNPRLKQIIEEGIVEKVGPSCNITDIQLDKESCCVYIRCSTKKDAGIVHSMINGWWFDNNLLSIKFLRLQRYLNRFPDSASSLSQLSI